MDKQIKTIQYKVADIDGRQRMVKFYYGAFGNVDNDGDTLHKGATIKTTRERGPAGKAMIRHYINHEFKNNPAVLPVGMIKEMGEDEMGPWVWSKMARTTTGADLYNMYDDGMINHHSMGFIPTKSRKNKTGLDILEIKLFEVSTITTWAANENTPTIDVKEQKEAVIRDTLNEYESLFLKPSRYTSQQKADLTEVLQLINF
jgi:HK97 family phage prohead protease